MHTPVFWMTAILEFFLWLALLRYLFGTFALIVDRKHDNKMLWIRALVSLLLFYGAFVACPMVRHSDAFREAATHATATRTCTPRAAIRTVSPGKRF